MGQELVCEKLDWWAENVLLSWEMILALSLHFKLSAKDQPVTGQVAGAPSVLSFLSN